MIQTLGRAVAGGIAGWCIATAYSGNTPVILGLLFAYAVALVAANWPED